MTKILILEDDLCSQLVWKAVISKSFDAAEVRSYTCIEEALKDFGSFQELERCFNLIITDGFLSGLLTGFDLLMQVSSRATGKVVLSSGSDQISSLLEHRLEELECQIVPKPLDVQGVRQCLATVLKAG